MTTGIRISLGNQALAIDPGEGKSLEITQDLTKDESREILGSIARNLVDRNQKVSSSQLKVQLKDNAAWVRASNFGHGSNAARSVFQKLIKNAYGEAGEQLLAQHLQNTNSKTIEADSYVKLFIELEKRNGGLSENDPLHEVRLDHARFSAPVAAKREIVGGSLDLTSLPANIRAGLNANFGKATPEFIGWGIQSGQIDLGISNIENHQIDVKELERDGASTLGLFRVKVDGRPQFIIKECGTFYEGDFYAGYKRNAQGVWTDPEAFEDVRLREIEAGPFGTVESLSGPEDSHFRFAHTQSTCRYETGQLVGTSESGLPEDKVRGKVEHQLTVIQHAIGEPSREIFSSASVSESTKVETAKLLGHGIGALHKKFIDGEQLETGGFRTLIHGDYHPANIFVDREKKIVTAIDLAGSIGNFEEKQFDRNYRAHTVKKDPAGWDLLRELKRAISQGALNEAGRSNPEVIQSFLTGYAENFTDLKDDHGKILYTADSLAQMIANYHGESSALT